MRKIRKSRRGFTLVEVMFSVAVLAIASLGVMGVLTYSAVAGDTAGNFSEATQLGRELIENIRVDRLNLDPFNPPAGLVSQSPSDRTPLNAAPLDGISVSVPDLPRFTRNITITEVEVDRLARIDIRIFWIQQGKEKVVTTSALARSGT